MPRECQSAVKLSGDIGRWMYNGWYDAVIWSSPGLGLCFFGDRGCSCNAEQIPTSAGQRAPRTTTWHVRDDARSLALEAARRGRLKDRWRLCETGCFWSGACFGPFVRLRRSRAGCFLRLGGVFKDHGAERVRGPVRTGASGQSRGPHVALLDARSTAAACLLLAALRPSSSFCSHPSPPPSSPRAPTSTPTMHKISNFTGSARHGWEKMAPSAGFPFSRSNHEMPVTAPIKRPSTATSAPPVIPPGTQVNLSFNVPFSSNLPGPDPDDIMWASPGAKARWTHPEGTAEATPTHKLPVHAQNVDNLRNLCRDVSEQTEGRVQATVTSAESKPLPGLQRGPLRALVTNVCLSGELEIVNSMRCKVLNSTPISLVGFSRAPLRHPAADILA
jgi:hypothetical protein